MGIRAGQDLPSRPRKLDPRDGSVHESEDVLQTLLAGYAMNALACWPAEKIQVESWARCVRSVAAVAVRREAEA